MKKNFDQKLIQRMYNSFLKFKATPSNNGGVKLKNIEEFEQTLNKLRDDLLLENFLKCEDIFDKNTKTENAQKKQIQFFNILDAFYYFSQQGFDVNIFDKEVKNALLPILARGRTNDDDLTNLFVSLKCIQMMFEINHKDYESPILILNMINELVPCFKIELNLTEICGLIQSISTDSSNQNVQIKKSELLNKLNKHDNHLPETKRLPWRIEKAIDEWVSYVNDTVIPIVNDPTKLYEVLMNALGLGGNTSGNKENKDVKKDNDIKKILPEDIKKAKENGTLLSMLFEKLIDTKNNSYLLGSMFVPLYYKFYEKANNMVHAEMTSGLLIEAGFEPTLNKTTGLKELLLPKQLALKLPTIFEAAREHWYSPFPTMNETKTRENIVSYVKYIRNVAKIFSLVAEMRQKWNQQPKNDFFDKINQPNGFDVHQSVELLTAINNCSFEKFPEELFNSIWKNDSSEKKSVEDIKKNIEEQKKRKILEEQERKTLEKEKVRESATSIVGDLINAASNTAEEKAKLKKLEEEKPRKEQASTEFKEKKIKNPEAAIKETSSTVVTSNDNVDDNESVCSDDDNKEEFYDCNDLSERKDQSFKKLEEEAYANASSILNDVIDKVEIHGFVNKLTMEMVKQEHKLEEAKQLKAKMEQEEKKRKEREQKELEKVRKEQESKALEEVKQLKEKEEAKKLEGERLVNQLLTIKEKQDRQQLKKEKVLEALEYVTSALLMPVALPICSLIKPEFLLSVKELKERKGVEGSFLRSGFLSTMGFIEAADKAMDNAFTHLKGKIADGKNWLAKLSGVPQANAKNENVVIEKKKEKSEILISMGNIKKSQDEEDQIDKQIKTEERKLEVVNTKIENLKENVNPLKTKKKKNEKMIKQLNETESTSNPSSNQNTLFSGTHIEDRRKLDNPSLNTNKQPFFRMESS